MQGEQMKEDDEDAPKKNVPQLEKKLAELLEKREQQDAQVNKQMIKATVGRQMAGNNGQNCW